jgi:hypothetical protein
MAHKRRLLGETFFAPLAFPPLDVKMGCLDVPFGRVLARGETTFYAVHKVMAACMWLLA